MSATEAVRIIGRRGGVVERASTKFACSGEGRAVRQIDYAFTTYHSAHSGSTTVYHVCLDDGDRVVATRVTLIDFD